jgi:hypothetical protein
MNLTTRNPGDPISPLGAVLFALAFALAGGAIVALSAGWIPSSPGAMHAPRWVLAAAGIMFIAGGFTPLAQLAGERSWLAWISAGAAMVCLALIFNWIAFGPGSRQFSGSMSVGPLSSSALTDERSGRILFGVFALLLDAMLVAFAVRWIRSRARPGS